MDVMFPDESLTHCNQSILMASSKRFCFRCGAASLVSVCQLVSCKTLHPQEYCIVPFIFHRSIYNEFGVDNSVYVQYQADSDVG